MPTTTTDWGQGNQVHSPKTFIRTRPPPPQAPIGWKRTGAPQFFEGGRSGSNYFLRFSIKNSNQELETKLVSGRSGQNYFQISPNGIVQTAESTNAIAAFSQGPLDMIHSLFCMGISQINGDIKWTGNAFEASGDNATGKVYGRLELTNGVPWQLTLADKRGASPYLRCVYDYPDPIGALSGYPLRMVIWTLFEDGLFPAFEWRLFEVKRASTLLPDDFFAAEKFTTSKTLYATIISNNTRYSVSGSGQVIKQGAPPSAFPEKMQTAARRGLVTFVLLLGALLCPLLIWLRIRRDGA